MFPAGWWGSPSMPRRVRSWVAERGERTQTVDAHADGRSTCFARSLLLHTEVLASEVETLVSSRVDGRYPRSVELCSDTHPSAVSFRSEVARPSGTMERPEPEYTPSGPTTCHLENVRHSTCREADSYEIDSTSMVLFCCCN